MRKPLLIITLSFLLTLIPLSIVWLHHQFITGLNPFLGVIITPIILITAISGCVLLFKTFKKYISFAPDVFFVIGLSSYLILIFVQQIFYGNSALDIHLHDTYFVISNFYPLFFIAIVFAIFAAIYHWFSKIFKRQMNNALGYIHFWITFLTISLLLLPTQYIAITDMPRRYYDYNDSHSFNALNELNSFILITVIILFIAQLLFIFNFCYSIYRGKKVNVNQ